MNQMKYTMVEYLDEPERILFFTVDEFIGLMLPIAIGIKMHHMAIGLVAGIGLLFLLNKLKAQDRDSFMQRFIYWYLPSKMSKLKYTPPSYLRTFIG